MKTFLINLTAVIFFMSMMLTVSYSQTKMIEVQKDIWIHEGWVNFGSIGYFESRYSGVQLDLINLRPHYFSLGVWSSYVFSPLDDKFSFGYWVPIGFYYPLVAGENFSFGIDSRANIFRDRNYYPRFAELSLRLDLKYAASVQFGFRFPDEDFVYNGERFNFGGVFLNVSAGIQVLLLNRITRNVMVEAPPPRLSVRWDGREEEIYLTHDAPSKEIDLIIANDGEGIAEDVELDVRLAGTPATELEITNTRPHLGDFPDRSVKGASVLMRAMEEIARYEELPITFNLTEKDGFRAERTYKLVLLPRVQPEQYPPVLTTEVGFEDENNNGVLGANESAEVVLTIYNEGRGNAWSLDGTIDLITEEYVPGFELLERDFMVRHIKPGSSETVQIPVRATREIPTTELEFMVNIQEANGFDLAPVHFSVETQEFQPPQLTIGEYSVRNEEGESIIKPVEVVEITVRIENIGEGVAEDVVFSVTPGENVFIVGAGRDYYSERIGTLVPDNYRDVTFEAFCNRYAESFPLIVTVREREGEYGVQDHKFNFAIQHAR